MTLTPGSLESKIRAFKELGAVGVLAAIAASLIYFVTMVVTPSLQRIPALEAAMRSHMRNDDETLRLHRLECRALRIMAKLDIEECDPHPITFPLQ